MEVWYEWVRILHFFPDVSQLCSCMLRVIVTTIAIANPY